MGGGSGVAFRFAGYFPKRIARADDRMAAAHVKEVWSVSTCLSQEPPAWIDRWRHNDLWLFDTVALAESVIPIGKRAAFRVLGYRIWDRMFDDGHERELPIVVKEAPGPEQGFTRVGFDAVSRARHSFGHSPLSCNGAAASFPANEACLFTTVDDALAGARAFSKGDWEPGPYWIVEVLRSPGV
jgi:hypothetical protein